MTESKVGKLTSPLHGDTETTQGGHGFVTKTLPEFEAFEGVSPHTANTMDTIGFR